MAYDDQTVDWGKLDPATYERMVSTLLSLLNPGVTRVDGAGGDGGRDVYFDGPQGLEIDELKSFHQRLTDKQKRQIKRSLERAASHKPASWRLILPLDLSPAEQSWFDKLTMDRGFVCSHLGRTWLDGQMAAHPSIPRYYLQGAAKEVTQLLKELNAEQAGLSRGVPDVVERLQKLAARADEIDPHYRFLIRLDGDAVNVSLVPRYSGAERDRPITITTEFRFPETEEARQVQADLQDALGFGTRAAIPAAFVGSVTIDGGPTGLDGSHGPAELFIEGAQVNGPEFRLRWVILDPEGRTLTSVPLTVGPRTVGATGVEAMASDPAGALNCKLRLNMVTRQFNVRYDISLPPACLPALALPTIRLLNHYCAPNHAQFQSDDGTPLGPPVELTNTEPLVPDGLLEIFLAFDRVQSQTGIFFDLPSEFNEQIIGELRLADSLLQGETVRMTFDTHSGVVRLQEFVQLAQEAGIDLLAGDRCTQWLIREHSVELAGHQLPVGVCTFVLRSVAIANLEEMRTQYANHPDCEFTVTFVPGSTDAALLRLGQGHSSISDPAEP
jgi:hypothetical protein